MTVTPPPMVPAIVPASGRSSRMGTAKALLDADGRTFLERVTGSLAAGGCFPIYVVVEDLRSPVAAVARTAGCLPVLNPDPSEGPISSIRAGLAELPGDAEGFMVCPVDHPRFQPETVAALLHAFQGTRPRLVVPAYQGVRGHPTLFRRDMEAELMEPELEEGARTVVLRHANDALEVAVDDAGVRADIDTLAEYRRYYPSSYRKRFHAR